MTTHLKKKPQRDRMPAGAETFRTKDGKTIIIREISANDRPRPFMVFINELVDEKVYILMDRRATLKEEKEWLRKRVRGKRDGSSISLIAWDSGRVAGNASAERGPYRESQNVTLGIALLKPYRNSGLGTYLLKRIIGEVKQRMRPKNIFLTVHSDNRPAMRLYRRLGFRTIGRLPDWILHEGKYCDSVQMLYKSR